MKNEVDLNSPESKENHNAMLSALNSVKTIEHQIRDLSDKKKVQGKLNPFERLEKLIDNNSSFLELSSIAGYHVYGEGPEEAGGGLITGIGTINNIRCAIMINNYTVKGGTFSPSGMKKILRLQSIALKNKLPLVHLLESGGANLNHAADIFVAGGEAFANQARLSAAGIPQLVVVHGNATAGGAYQPGMADLVILIKDQSKMFLGGPPLVQAATGEIATEEQLGGTPLHSKTTGTGEFLVENDSEAISKARELVLNFKNIFPINEEVNNDKNPPHYSSDEILSLIPSNPKKSYDVKKLWQRLIDGDSFEEFKKEFDHHTICAFSSFNGMKVGMIGNNGPITSDGANKAAQFMQLCDQLHLPLIFFHNTTGFMVGTHSEKTGMIKHGSKMIQAVTNARVPKISFVIGGSYGAGNYAMCGRGMDPDFIFSWPNSKTAVMGGEQAAKVMRLVTEAKNKYKGIENDKQKLDVMEEQIKRTINDQAHALFGSARLWDDGIIDPRATRDIIIQLLIIFEQREKINLKSNTFGIARL